MNPAEYDPSVDLLLQLLSESQSPAPRRPMRGAHPAASRFGYDLPQQFVAPDFAPQPNGDPSYEGLLQQMAPAFADRQRAPQLSYSMPEDVAASYLGSPRSSRNYSYSRSDPYLSLYKQLLGGQIQSGLMDQRYVNQDALAQDRYEQQAQLQDVRLAHQDQEAAMREAGMMGRQFSRDIPQWIQEGMSNGSLRYSPAQLRERQDLFDSIDRIHADERFTPEQRANFEARQREQIRRIDLSPQEVPPNERPVTPQQQADQMSWEEEDPTSGLKVRKYMGMRNGQPQPELDPISDAHVKDWLDRQRHARDMERMQWEFDHREKKDTSAQDAARIRGEEIRIRKYKDSKLRDYRKALDAVNLADSDLRMINSGTSPKDGKGNPIELDPEEAMRRYTSGVADLQRLQSEIDGIDQQIAELHANDGVPSATDRGGVGLGVDGHGMSAEETFSLDPAISFGAGGGISPEQAPPLGGDMPAPQPPADSPQAEPGGGMTPTSVTVNSEAELQQVLSDPSVPRGTVIIWGPTGISRPK